MDRAILYLIFRRRKEFHAVSSNLQLNQQSSAKKKLYIYNKYGIKFSKDAGVFDRIHVNGTNNFFITLKDHKENFENNTKTRLINSAKNEISRISKVILRTTSRESMEKH